MDAERIAAQDEKAPLTVRSAIAAAAGIAARSIVDPPVLGFVKRAIAERIERQLAAILLPARPRWL